jgi:hypothetical protein
LGFIIIIAILSIWALISNWSDSTKRKRKEEQEKALFQRAIIADSNSQYKEAIQLYTQLINENPKPIYFNNRAHCKGLVEDLSGMISDYSNAILLCKSDDLYFFNRGITFWNKNHNELGLLDLAKASRLGNSEATAIIARDYVITRSFPDFRKSLDGLKLYSKLGYRVDNLSSQGDESSTWAEDTNYPMIIIPQELKRLLASKISARNEVAENRPDFMQDSIVEAHQNILDYILKTNSSTYKKESPRKGTSETYFHSYLKNSFGNQIIIDQLFDYYHPDFVLKHSLTNLTIDIEIDEPYGIENKDMFHGSTNLSENKRNVHFLSNRWIVVRLAEEQVLLYPKECCNLIGSIIYLITYDSSNLNSKEMSFPALVKRWQQNDKDLIQKKYRESYIKKWKTNNGK